MPDESVMENPQSEIKFTDEELDSLRQLQTDFQDKQTLLGQLSVQEIIINQQMEQIDNRRNEIKQEYVELQQREKNLVDELNQKYGVGSLNPETGVFTPTN